MYKIVHTYESKYSKVLYTAYSHSPNLSHVKLQRLWYAKSEPEDILTEEQTQLMGVRQVSKTKFVWAYEFKLNDEPFVVETGIAKSFDAALLAVIEDRWCGDNFHTSENGWWKVEIE